MVRSGSDRKPLLRVSLAGAASCVVCVCLVVALGVAPYSLCHCLVWFGSTGARPFSLRVELRNAAGGALGPAGGGALAACSRGSAAARLGAWARARWWTRGMESHRGSVETP